MLLRPGILEPSDGRQPASVLAEQRDQRLLEVAGGDALEVEDRDQHLEALDQRRTEARGTEGTAICTGLVVMIQGVGLGRPDRRGCRRRGLCAKPIHHHHRNDSEGRDGQVDVEVGTHSKNR
jgi:hypothetical protein